MSNCLHKISPDCRCRAFCLGLLSILFIHAGLFAQPQRYTVKIASFSKQTNDEFSPVFYKGGIVFCSNQRDNSLVSYNDKQNSLLKIFYVLRNNATGWRFPKLLAKEITTGFNDGPVTFNENGNIMYYSRNNAIISAMRNIADTANKLGIYSAELINGIWTNIKPFSYNNPLYSFSTPALTRDGQRLYFSSDMPGGTGGMDLYYCEWCDKDWCTPVNMGPVINTSRNESFPFADKNSRIFFSSDGHTGFGGMDLYYTMDNNGEWIVPVHLDSAINSTADDFGLVMDSTSLSGYFSTNRRKTDDIFSFSQVQMEFSNCDTIQEKNYCFTFYDERHQIIDTLPALYKWDFGNGIIRNGAEVKHCFPGPGEYSVMLDIIDEITGDTIAEHAEYEVKLDPIEQAYINSNNVALVNQSISLDALGSNLKDFHVTDYLWDFGDGFDPGGPVMHKIYTKDGEYAIRLGLLMAKNDGGEIQKTCVIKTIRIYDTCEELAMTETDAAGKQSSGMQIIGYLMDDLSERQKKNIQEAFKGPAGSVKFDQFGIMSSSDLFLNKVVTILQHDPEIRLEMVLHTLEGDIPANSAKISEKWAQELNFYFKNKEVDTDVFRCKNGGFSLPLLQPNIHGSSLAEGIIEFIYMKR